MGTIEDNSDRWRTPTHTHIRGPPDPRVRLVPRREHLHRAHLSGRTGPGNPPPHRPGRGRGGGGGAFSSTGINAANSRGLGTLLDKLEREHKRDSGAFLLRTGHLNHNAMNREFEARCGQGDPGTERVGLWREHARRAKSKEIRQRRKGVLRLQRRAEVLQEEQRLEREEERAKRAPSAKSAGGGGEPGAEDNLASDGDQPEELRSENNSAKPETDDGEAEGGVDHSDVEDEKDPFLTGDPEGAAARAKPVAPKLMDLLKQYDYLKSATRSVSPPSVREDGEEDADGRKKAGRVSPGAYERGRGCLPSLTASHHGLSTSTLPEGTTRSELYQALRRFDRDVIEREYKYKYRNHRTLREREEVLARDLAALGPEESSGPSFARLAVYSACFDRLIASFQVYGPLLAAVKREYDAIIARFRDSGEELSFLRAKVRKLLAQNENRLMLKHEKKRSRDLEEEIRRLKSTNETLKTELQRKLAMYATYLPKTAVAEIKASKASGLDVDVIKKASLCPLGEDPITKLEERIGELEEQVKAKDGEIDRLEKAQEEDFVPKIVTAGLEHTLHDVQRRLEEMVEKNRIVREQLALKEAEVLELKVLYKEKEQQYVYLLTEFHELSEAEANKIDAGAGEAVRRTSMAVAAAAMASAATGPALPRETTAAAAAATPSATNGHKK